MKHIFLLLLFLAQYNCSYGQTGDTLPDPCFMLKKALSYRFTSENLGIDLKKNCEYNILLGKYFLKCTKLNSFDSKFIFYSSRDSFQRKYNIYNNIKNMSWGSDKNLYYFEIGAFIDNGIFEIVMFEDLPNKMFANYYFKRVKKYWVLYKEEAGEL